MAKKELKGPGRIAGLTPGARTIESIRKQREHIYGAVLRGALGGDGECARVCLELIGDLPVEQVISTEA